MGTIIGEILVVFRYSESDSSILGAVFVVGGIIGSILIGLYIENTKAYRIACITLGLLCTIATLLQIMFINSHVSVIMYLIGFFEGIATIPVSVPAIDYGVEITYPLGESYSNTILSMSGNLGTLLVSHLCSFWIDQSDFENTKD